MVSAQELLNGVRSRWKACKNEYKANPSLFSDHVSELDQDDVDDLIETIGTIERTLGKPRRRSAAVRAASQACLDALVEAQAHLQSTTSGNWHLVKQAIAALARASSAMHEASKLVDDSKEPTVGTLVAMQAEALAQLESVRTRLEGAYQLVAESKQQAVSAEAASQSAQTAEKAAQSTLRTIEGHLEASRKAADEGSASLISLQGAGEKVNKFAETVSDTEEKIAAVRVVLDQLVDQARVSAAKIEALIPGATAVSLASSFRTRRVRAEKAALAAAALFLVSLALFGWIVWPYLEDLDVSQLGAVAARLLRLSPIIGIAVWVGWVAIRQYGHNARIAEDYAHKEAVAVAFEGFRGEMSKLDKDPGDSPSKLLSAIVLSIISRDPMRAYDRKADEHPMMDVASDVREKISGWLGVGKK